MMPEVELWSPEQELRLLEELAETEAKAFDLDLGWPTAIAAAEQSTAPSHAEPRSPPGRNSAKSATSAPTTKSSSGMSTA